MGKSALAKSTVNYALERELIAGGCIYLDCSSIYCLGELNTQLVSQVEADQKVKTDGSE